MSATPPPRLTYFHLFPHLPLEIRLKIYAHILTSPRTIKISCKKSLIDVEEPRITEYFIYQSPPHPLLSLCHESRTEALTTYSFHPHFRTRHSERYLPVNFTYTTIHCAASVLEYFGRDEIAGIKRMVLEVGDAAYFGHFHMDTLRRMGNLVELELRTQKGEANAWGEFNAGALLRDFEDRRMVDLGWRCPRVRIVDAGSGEVLEVVEGGALVEGDEYPSHLLES